ncbi:hypothetical protein [Cupriavidus sp. USMAA2-4]|uniref:hypothetical protein n=1 Tax=Cupriavidus sp. USMAA2-4 TaxID=876364 RepID=UPI0012F49A09|nr:hypothetical protein [Cupriavidus sp. USMAA2-4]
MSDLEKRIATAIEQGFLQFSQLLAGLEVILLEGEKLGVVREESILGLEQLFVHLTDDRRELVGVPDPNGGPADVLRDGDCCRGTAEK